ncbi:TonB-dependent receptor [Marinoscillum sp. 108]|uniref:TonB-dependent receptor n=1 Tax=Marinoscillum sp. 108 TaxID=2653151 RepID=UPI0012F42A7B|nr:TonB-dependent receptor [Marinoscillum sp. 108]VXD18640.1 TonB-dependent receptor-like protein [Marinoscillum sp. 108]
MKKLILTLLSGVLLLSASGQEKFTISGYVKDQSDGETLIGATVLIRELSSGNITNVYGFYSITIPPGEYSVEYRYVGYQPIQKTVSLNQNVRLDVELLSTEQKLEEVVVTAKPEDENVSGMEMSTAELDITTIQKIPAFLGEVDVVKSLQLLPGVTTVGEGASGFNVRGGSVGQNLILLDEAPVYNSSHMFGFFSVFNPDAVKDVKLYKGGIPAEYGGRLSSILDVRMKEGNIKNYEVNGGVGTIFSRFAVEGPIAKNKSSFILAGRRSYIDVLAQPFLKNNDLDGVGLRFYDLTGKTNYYISDKDRIYLSGYLGRDVFKFDANQGFDWGNKTASLRWNHLFNDRIFSNTTLFLSDYDYSFQVGETKDDLFSWKSRILTYNFKEQFSYFINTSNELSFGAEAILYRFKPAEVLGVSDGEESDISLDERKSIETAIYLGNTQKVNDRLSLQYGVRLSGFQYLGAGSIYYYEDAEVKGERRPVSSIEQADNWETIQFYSNLEPRFSFKYSVNPSTSIKGSYNRMSQYIHLVSNTTASLPTDVWTPSTNNIKPQLADQVALGVFKNFLNNQLETSVEVYYKESQNQVDYIDGAEILINRFLEGDLLSGDGRAYGAEFFVKKNSGKINGWVSYTLARTELKVEGINEGDWYPTRFDQTHNVKVTANYDWSEKWSVSANFTYITGTPYTLPSYRYENQGYTIPGVLGRNNGRIPDYHRLDLSATWYMRTLKSDGSPKKLQDHWVFTVYNVYARRNPFSIYFAQTDDLSVAGQAITQANQVSILGTFVPAVSYNFKF